MSNYTEKKNAGQWAIKQDKNNRIYIERKKYDIYSGVEAGVEKEYISLSELNGEKEALNRRIAEIDDIIKDLPEEEEIVENDK